MLKSKLQKKLPAIKFLGKLSHQRDINELFKPVKKLNFEHEDEENVNCSQEEWKGKDGERFRKIYNENKKLVSKLTSEFRSTLMEMRKEMEESRPFLSESIDELKQILLTAKNKKVEDLSCTQIEDPIEIDDYVKGNTIEEEDSQTWILLQAHCNERSCKETDANYCHEETVLKRPQVDWRVFNKSVIKCQEWLNKTEIK